jgi:hypothetical protein
MTSLLLLPAMWIFNGDYRAAVVTMALISGASVFGFAYLLEHGFDVRSRWIRVLAVLVFAFAPAMQEYRLDTDSTPVMHLFLIMALIALTKARYALVCLIAAAFPFVRGDGAVIAAMLVSFALWRSLGKRAPPGELKRSVAICVLCVVGYVLYSYAVFGAPTPPGASTALRLRRGVDLYTYGFKPRRQLAWIWAQRMSFDYFYYRATVALETMLEIIFVSAQSAWYGTILAGAILQFRRVNASVMLIFGLFFVAPIALASAAPAVYASWRTLHVMVPVIVLAGALALDQIETLARSRLLPALPDRIGMWLMRAVSLAAALFFLSDLKPYTTRPESAILRALQKKLVKIDQQLGGEPVLSMRPWFVIAYTRSPAVMMPVNGEEALAEVIRKYKVGWLLIEGRYTLAGSTKDIIKALEGTKRWELDEFVLERTPNEARLPLFRVTEKQP